MKDIRKIYKNVAIIFLVCIVSLMFIYSNKNYITDSIYGIKTMSTTNTRGINKLSVYAYTLLPSTPNTSMSDEEKKYGNRTFNLQDFNIYKGKIYFTKQSRGSCTLTNPYECNDLLNQVTVYRFNKKDSKYYDIKDAETMVLNNSGHGTVFNNITFNNNNYMILGVNGYNNNGLRKWNNKWIGTSQYYSYVTFSQKETDIQERIAKKTAFKAYNSSGNSLSYIYDIGVDEKNYSMSARNNSYVYIYKYNTTSRPYFKNPLKTIKINVNGSVQGHDIYNNKIYILHNSDIEVYNLNTQAINKYTFGNNALYDALKNDLSSEELNNVKYDSIEPEGIKVDSNGNVYMGMKLQVKNKVYSYIFKVTL